MSDQPRVVLICQACHHAWEPGLDDPAELTSLGCRRCGGWTWMGEVMGPDSAPTAMRRAAQ